MTVGSAFIVALGRRSHSSSPRSLSLMNPCEEFFGQNTEYSSSFENAPASLGQMPATIGLIGMASAFFFG